MVEQRLPEWSEDDVILSEWHERVRPYHYDPSRFHAYLEQLGIRYPTVRREPTLEQR